MHHLAIHIDQNRLFLANRRKQRVATGGAVLVICEEPGLGIFHGFLPDEFPHRRKRRNVIESNVIQPSKYGIFNMPYFDTLTLDRIRMNQTRVGLIL